MLERSFEDREQNPLVHKSIFKDFIIEICKNNNKIIITIADKNTKNVRNQKSFSFEEIEKYDSTFFLPFNRSIDILFKFLTRLLLAQLIYVEICKERKDIIFINLICLKNNEIRSIKIDIPSINFENNFNNIRNDKINKEKVIEKYSYNNNNNIIEDNFNVASAPVVSSIKKNINKYNIHSNEMKFNKKYNIELSKKENQNGGKTYKEIKFEISSISDNNIRFYNYLNHLEIFNDKVKEAIPYYSLFNDSIDDVFDDLNITIKNGNYRFDVSNKSIKLFFQIINFGNGGNKEPYKFIFVRAYKGERTEEQLNAKMEEYFSELNDKKENQNQKSEIHVDKKIDGANKIKEKDSNIKADNKNKMDSQTFLTEFLKLKNTNIEKQNNNLENHSNNLKNHNNNLESHNLKGSFFNISANDENWLKNDSKNKNEKKFKKIKAKGKSTNNNNNENNSINCNKNNNNNHNNNKSKDIRISNDKINNFYHDSKTLLGNKRTKDLKLDNFMQKSNNNIIEKNHKEKAKNDNEKINQSIEHIKNKASKKEEKNENDKISNSEQKDNSKNHFHLNGKKKYNINKNSIMKKYQYSHDLDKDDEWETIEDEVGNKFCLCKICNVFFKDRYSVRKHQWDIHNKPFGEVIQEELKNKNNK